MERTVTIKKMDEKAYRFAKASAARRGITVAKWLKEAIETQLEKEGK